MFVKLCLFSSEMHTKLARIQNRTKVLGQIVLCKQCRPRSDATENTGMKLIWGNKEHGNLENTVRTIRRATSEDSDQPVDSYSLISLRCSHELLWAFLRAFYSE